MTDKNGRPLKVGDKVTHRDLPNTEGEVVSVGELYVNVRFPNMGVEGCAPKNLTLVEPEPEQVHKIEPNGEVVPLAEPGAPAGVADVERITRASRLIGLENQHAAKFECGSSAVEFSSTNVFEALGRDNAEELFRKAELVSRVRDIMDGFERTRFPQIADEILKAVSAYHE